MSTEAAIILAAFIGLFIGFYMFGKQQLTKRIEEGASFLAKNKERADVLTTPSGLQYQYLEHAKPQEQTLLPRVDSTVTVHYHGTLLDGTVFDSSEQRNKPISFQLNQVIAGWTEGLQLMQSGDKVRFYIPHQLAYGTRKAGPIPAGSTLIFDVKLISFH